MADIESLLSRWLSAGVLEPAGAERIRAWERGQTAAAEPNEKTPRHADVLRVSWQGMVALGLGAFLLGAGVILFVSAHWQDLGPASRLLLVLGMVTVFHLGGAVTRDGFRGLSTAFHAVGTISTGAAIALVGQIFNIQEHWPAAILVWALAALAGWALLRDQAQQTIALLLVPAWMFCEILYSVEQHIGNGVYEGRFLVMWSILYITVFLHSKRRAVRSFLFAVSAIAGGIGVGLISEGWQSWSPTLTFVPVGSRVWVWIAIVSLPLVIATFRGHWGLIPMAAALFVSTLLPWCQTIKTYIPPQNTLPAFTYAVPNLLAHALVAAFAVFIIAWGVHEASRALVNLGMVYFAIAVGWFYFSDLFDKFGRSLGLIGLGVLFLAGGWALEKTRRRLIARIGADVPLPGNKETAEAQ